MQATEHLAPVADKLLHTLERCEPQAPHAIDLARIKIIRQLIVWATQRDDHAAYWDAELRRAEHAADMQGGAR